MPRSFAIEQIQKLGGKVNSSISKKTDFLIVGLSPGTKVAKAINLGVEVLSEENFLEFLK